MSAVADRIGARRRGTSRAAWLREQGIAASVLVAAISSAFGVILLSATGYIEALLSSDPYIGQSGTLAVVLAIMSTLLIAVAVYVAAIVTANTFATIIAGRTGRIALLRLIGSSARSQRTEVARQGLVVGALGASIGLVVGVAVSASGIVVLGEVLGIDGVAYSVVRPVLLVPAVAVVLTTWAAAWAGSRRVLTVTPLQAIGGAVAPSHETLSGRRGRRAVAIGLSALGCGLLAAGIGLGLVSPLGVVVAFAGGILSFTGLVLAAPVVMPPLLRAVGRIFGSSATARLAAENALRDPERSSRMAIGVVMGVALVTMFAVAAESVKAVLSASWNGDAPAEMLAVIDAFSGVMMALVAVSAVIAAVGLVNLLTIGIVQRRRELGLVRSLGMSSAQVRRMVLLEAVHVIATAVSTGLVLGAVYGWAGAQSLLGSVAVPPHFTSPTFVAPGMPWTALAVIVVAAAGLTLVASVAPTRAATRVAPIEALAE